MGGLLLGSQALDPLQVALGLDASDDGLLPQEIDGAPGTFSAWYLHWLAESERTARIA